MRRPAAAVIQIAALLNLLPTGPVLAGSFEDAIQAYDRGDYKAAYRLMKPLAEQGDASAQVRLGFMYEGGNGVPQDHSEAAKWIGKAAELGEIHALVYLCLPYFSMLDEGERVSSDYPEGIKWCRKAAEQGDYFGHTILGEFYAEGKGVPRDYVLAYMWLTLSECTSDTIREMTLGMVSEEECRVGRVSRIDNVASKMTPTRIAEAQRMAREWRREKER